MFILLGMIFSLIIFVAFFGDYNEKELKEEYKKYEEIVYANRDTTKVAKPK